MTVTVKVELLIICFITCCISATGAVNVSVLSTATYAEATNEKIVFLRFFAPWCGHCQQMAPSWERIYQEYANEKNILIAEVDCTSEDSLELCSFANVQNFPSLKYGEPYWLHDYGGGLEYNDLSNFARDNLKPGCSPHNIHLCNDRRMINKFEHYKSMTENDLAEDIKEAEGEILWLETDMNRELEKLQDLYYSVQNKYEKELKVMALSMSKTNEKLRKGETLMIDLLDKLEDLHYSSADKPEKDMNVMAAVNIEEGKVLDMKHKELNKELDKRMALHENSELNHMKELNEITVTEIETQEQTRIAKETKMNKELDNLEVLHDNLEKKYDKRLADMKEQTGLRIMKSIMAKIQQDRYSSLREKNEF